MKTNITLVTGCSTGIGRALAEFHRRGHVVYATARRVSTLSALEARGIRTATLEVTEAAIERIPLRAPTGAIVPLAEVASIEIGEGHTFVRREGLRRYAIVQMDVQGRDVDGFVRDANAAIARTVKLPTGYWTEWSGAFENQQRALTGLALIVPLTIFFIFVLKTNPESFCYQNLHCLKARAYLDPPTKARVVAMEPAAAHRTVQRQFENWRHHTRLPVPGPRSGGAALTPPASAGCALSMLRPRRAQQAAFGPGQSSTGARTSPWAWLCPANAGMHASQAIP